MSQKAFVDLVTIPKPCSEDWEKMKGTDQVRFCSHCAENVTDLSTMTRKSAARLIKASNGKLCVRYVTVPGTTRPKFAAIDPFVRITRRAPLIAAGVIGAALSLTSAARAQSDEVIIEPLPGPLETRVANNDPSAETETTPVATVGSISGTIRDLNGKPVAGVELALMNVTESFVVKEAATDANGRYVFDELDEASYSLLVNTVSHGNRKAAPTLVLGEGQMIVQDLNVRVVAPDASAGSGSGNGFGSGFGGAMSMPSHTVPLIEAIYRDDQKAVVELLKQGADPDARDEPYDNITALFAAVENGDLLMTKVLLEHGASVNITDDNGRTPLMMIDDDADVELIDTLLAAGARVNARSKDGSTPLVAAIHTESADIVRRLIEAGAEVDRPDEGGVTPLMEAVSARDNDIVELLIASGADARAVDKAGESVWDRAYEPELVQLLESAGAIPNYDLDVLASDDGTAEK